MRFEPLKMGRIWPLGVGGRKFLCTGPAEVRAWRENSEDWQAAATVWLDHGRAKGSYTDDVWFMNKWNGPHSSDFCFIFSDFIEGFYLLCTVFTLWNWSIMFTWKPGMMIPQRPKEWPLRSLLGIKYGDNKCFYWVKKNSGTLYDTFFSFCFFVTLKQITNPSYFASL